MNSVAPARLHTSRLAAALAIMLCAQAAHAAFIDERKPAPKLVNAPAAAASAPAPATPAAGSTAAVAAPLPQAGVATGAVDGVFTDPGWKDGAPRLAAPVSVPSAISRLLPVRHPAVTVEGDDSSLDDQVSWPDSGLTRKEALEHVARSYGLNFMLGNGVMRVSKAKVSAGLAMYAASPADLNFRRLFKRWAVQAGYTFGDEHWTLPRDVPIVASASLGTDFKSAVREVLDSTELTSMPARPCFYSNKVLRVVPRNEQCDRLSARN